MTYQAALATLPTRRQSSFSGYGKHRRAYPSRCLVTTVAPISGSLPGSFPENPLAAFERCVWVVPYWEEPIHDLIGYVPVERILAGSDFPHSDGLPEPTAFAKALTEFSDDDVRRIMRDNLKSILVAP